MNLFVVVLAIIVILLGLAIPLAVIFEQLNDIRRQDNEIDKPEL